MSISTNLKEILKDLPTNVTLVAVSKTKPNAFIEEAYKVGQRVFGENKVQELVAKYESLPKDIHWHMIGHLQTNKVKYIAPFVSLIHGVDSLKLLKEINKQGAKNQRVIPILLQMHIAKEETKFGLSEEELHEIISFRSQFSNIEIKGLMGMATFTDNEETIANEFKSLKNIYDTNKDSLNLSILSMGMSGDYKLAIANGSSMIRVGSSIFGTRN